MRISPEEKLRDCIKYFFVHGIFSKVVKSFDVLSVAAASVYSSFYLFALPDLA